MPDTETKQIQIVVNGEPRSAPSPQTVESVLAALGVDSGRVAVELNRAIIRKPEWSATPVPDGSTLEIVQFVGGG